MKKTLIVLTVLLILFMAFYFLLFPKLGIISGYNAKIMCSCRFISHIEEEQVTRIDLGFGPLFLANNIIDESKKQVTSSVFGLKRKTAIYRNGLGCTLINDLAEEKVTSQQMPFKTVNKDLPAYAGSLWGKEKLKNLANVSDVIFDEENDSKFNSRAVVILKDGKLLYEKYAPEYDENSRLLGWSMSKSVTSALVGILSRKGIWQKADKLQIPEWQNDERKRITTEDALQMSSGLSWVEDYGDVSNATIMLYESDTMGSYAATTPLENNPGEEWKYSSGTSNLLAWYMEDFFENNQEYLEFPYRELFHPIGAGSFVFETDASGHFVGSSYCYATGRDWAKLGQLYLNEGNWEGRQILDSSWVEFSRTPAPGSNGKYGGHFWLNQDKHLADCPQDMYYMDGFQGQRVFIIPSENLVIVRLGVTYNPEDLNLNQWVANIIAAAK